MYNLTEEQIQAEIQLGKKLYCIDELKKLLSLSDYKAIKFGEGLISESDYALTREQRQTWRDQINNLKELTEWTDEAEQIYNTLKNIEGNINV